MVLRSGVFVASPPPTDLVYANARDDFTEARISWPDSTNVKCALIGPGYAPLLTHKFMSQIPGASVLARSPPLTNLANSNGVCSGLIPTFQSLLLVDQVIGMLLYLDTGDDTTSQLLYYSSKGVGFPFFAQGFDYFIGFDLANGGWFQV